MTYKKFMCDCGFNVGICCNYEMSLKCIKCSKMMKSKVMKDGCDDNEWNSIKIEDCK